MPKSDPFFDPFTHPIDSQPGEETDTELALNLQNGAGSDPIFMGRLIARFGPEITRFAWVLNSGARDTETRRKIVRRTVEEVFSTAVAEISQFWGQESLRQWLTGLTLRVCRATRRGKDAEIRAGLSEVKAENIGNRRNEIQTSLIPNQYLWVAFDRLTGEQRLALVLHHLSGFSLAEVSQLLGTSRESIENQVASAHAQLLPLLPKMAIRGEVPSGADLPAVFRERWPLPLFPPAEIEKLVRAILARLDRKRSGLPRRAIWSGAWSMLLLSLLVGIFWLFNRSEVRLTNRPVDKVKIPTGLPAPLEAGAGSGPEVSQDTILSLPEFSFSIEPFFSADGRTIVFTSSDWSLVPGDSNNAMDIFVVDRESRSIERVNLSSTGEQANGSSYSPSISADGRWVAFASTASNLVPSGGSVSVGEGIYLHDRQTGQTSRIDTTLEANSGNEHGFSPVISAGGQTVAYWARAGKTSCPGGSAVLDCLDIYVYNRLTEKTDQISIARPWERLVWDRRLAISANGRSIALTIYPFDGIAGRLGVRDYSSVFVYDLQNGRFSLASVPNSGDVGEGDSYAPNISEDGQVIAFVSRAPNLVPNDTNGESDIFVHDMQTGVTERVSVGAGGEQGDGYSGVSLPGLASWRDNVGLSGDGQTVTFLSTSRNLDSTPGPDCQPQSESDCNAVYLHDRRSGLTERLTQPEPDRSYLFTTESGDGRFTVYVAMRSGCFPLSLDLICSELLLYDRPSQATSALTGNSPGKANAVWHMAAQLEGQSGLVNSLAFSPDGQLLATGSDNGRIEIWQVPGGENTTTLERAPGQGVSSAVTSLAFSPGGDLLAAGRYDGGVDIWRVSNGGLLFSLPEHPGKVIAVAFTGQGEQLVVGTPQSVWIWSVEEGVFRRVRNFDYPAGFITQMAVVPGGDYLALATNDKTVWIQRIDSPGVLLRLGGHAEKVMSVSVSPDGKELASGSIDGSINLWQVSPGSGTDIQATYLRTVRHSDWVKSLSISPDGKTLASGSLYGAIRLWSLPDGKLLEAPLADQTAQIAAAVFSPDGRTFAASSNAGTVYLWQKNERGPQPSTTEPDGTEMR